MYILQNDQAKIQVIEAVSIKSRMIGLMGKKHLEHGLLIRRCRLIHTFGMRSHLDLVFLDNTNTIVRLYEAIGANKMVFGGSMAQDVLELPPHMITTFGLTVGRQISLLEMEE